MRRFEQDASYTRRVITQLHRPAELKLERTQNVFGPPDQTGGFFVSLGIAVLQKGR